MAAGCMPRVSLAAALCCMCSCPGCNRPARAKKRGNSAVTWSLRRTSFLLRQYSQSNVMPGTKGPVLAAQLKPAEFGVSPTRQQDIFGCMLRCGDLSSLTVIHSSVSLPGPSGGAPAEGARRYPPEAGSKTDAMTRAIRLTALVVALVVALMSGRLLAQQSGGASRQEPPGRLAKPDLEALMRLEVTSVLRQSERLSNAAASIFLITGDEIRRAGATNLPEALRLAPNLDVVQVSATGYTVSARGLINSAANKLLVLIDGRSVYTPLFSGVFWDVQDVPLEDVERIEVISGPGGTLWGVNAVNGVINIITRSAKETEGGLLAAAAGNPASNGSLGVR